MSVRLRLCVIPSTRDVKRVMVAALRRPAGRVTPILSSLSLNARPPFFDLALHKRHAVIVHDLPLNITSKAADKLFIS